MQPIRVTLKGFISLSARLSSSRRTKPVLLSGHTAPFVGYMAASAAALVPFVPVASDAPASYGPFVGIDKIWHRVRASAGLRDVRLHDLRHSFASVAVGGGLSLPIIGALLGHKHAATIARYAHLAAAPLRAANDAVGAKITAAMQFHLVPAAPKRSA
jgi:hypothetical protein